MREFFSSETGSRILVWSKLVRRFSEEYSLVQLGLELSGAEIVELELLDFHVDDIQWGEQSSLVGRQLIVSLAEIQEQIKDLTPIIKLTAKLARPGESKRIIHVLDTLMPIAKVDDERRTFPGIDHPARLVGTGRTERLRNVLPCGRLRTALVGINARCHSVARR